MKILAGMVNLQDLTIKIQFHINDFCKLVKLPTYTYSYKERECLGNGWYGASCETITKQQENAYLVIHNDKAIGYIIATENGRYYLSRIKSEKFIENYANKHYKQI